MNKKLRIIIGILAINSLLFSQNADKSFIQGEILLSASCNLFNFPLRYSGAYISFPTDSTVQIDSLLYLVFSSDSKMDQPGYRNIENRKILPIDSIRNANKNDLNTININLPKSLIHLFRHYKVYFIKRVYDPFAYTDTIPKNIWSRSRQDSILSKGINQNRFLKIKFDKQQNVEKFVKDLNKTQCIQQASPNAILKTDDDIFFRDKYKLPYN